MRVYQRQAALAIVVLGAFGWALAACGSSGPSTQQVQATCQSVSAVLSDGPDPGADPVGYALAQVDPLRQIHTSDSSLQQAIDDLANAYESVYTSDNSKSAQTAVTKASNQVDAICPGATS
jgi:predicted Zn-dependent protease